MDAEIQFGEVEEERPRIMRRPDENRHYAVETCGAPREQDLPIYVDLDAMLEMEDHALSNTNVELGGVLLGGQYVDHDGQPFVVVSDCLRAEHYEATKGSFKFTHDTWSDIARRLEEFPEDLRMVGWYHTHPDWGVFLSGMDLFICENFFSRPLDLALVIDPCRGDRGWFQWLPQARRGPQRTGGFYLTSSRFRAAELSAVAQVLEGSSEMPMPVRTTAQGPGGYGAPVINVAADRNNQWMPLAVLGTLALQTALVALLAWGVLSGMSGGGNDQLASVEQRDRELEVRRKTLDDIAHQLVHADEGFVGELEDKQIKVRSLETSLATATEMQRELSAKVAALEKQRERDQKLKDELVARVDELKTRAASLERELVKANSGKETAKTAWSLNSPWLWTIIGVAVVSLLFGVIMYRSPKPNGADPFPEDLEPRSPHRSADEDPKEM